MGLNITEVRVKLTRDPRSKLKAYCSITFEHAFVVRDLKIIDGAKGPFVAMPSRKIADRCKRCHHKNNLQASFCNQCGSKLEADRASRDERGRARLHADMAHPIHSECRIRLHKAVVAAYTEEVAQSKLDGYQPKTFDDFEDDFEAGDYIGELLRRQASREQRTDVVAEPSPGARELEA